jgi:hypothetical protein
MEESLSAKLKEFMNVLDQVKQYSTLLTALPDFAIIIALSIILGLSAIIFSRFAIVFGSLNLGPNPSNSALFIIFLLTGILVGVYWVNRRVKSVKVGQWKETLDEGLPGVIKLLQELNWDNIFSDIRHAKLGSWLYSITKIAAYWILTVILFSVLTNTLQNVLHFGTVDYVVELFSLVLVLVLNKKDICKRYYQVGRLDMLFWELRWFESEFRGANFEA